MRTQQKGMGHKCCVCLDKWSWIIHTFSHHIVLWRDGKGGLFSHLPSLCLPSPPLFLPSPFSFSLPSPPPFSLLPFFSPFSPPLSLLPLLLSPPFISLLPCSQIPFHSHYCVYNSLWRTWFILLLQLIAKFREKMASQTTDSFKPLSLIASLVGISSKHDMFLSAFVVLLLHLEWGLPNVSVG